MLEKLLTNLTSSISETEPISRLENIDEVIATWHTHPYHPFFKVEKEGDPPPPSKLDLESSVTQGHHLVFSFGKDGFVIYAIQYGKPSVLRQYNY